MATLMIVTLTLVTMQTADDPNLRWAGNGEG
jgi:hypothetical protein